MVLKLTILRTWETELIHWLSIRMEEPGYLTYEDNFGWVKAKAQVNVGTEEVPIWELREKNAFDYQSIAEIAARHFLRLNGRIPPEWRKAGGAWPTVSVKLLKGGAKLSQSLSTRFKELVGAELEATINWPWLSQWEKPKLGDVLTISADYDAYVETTPTKTATTVILKIGYSTTTDFYRTGVRIPLTSLPSNPTISDVDLVVKVTDAASAQTVDVQAYNLNGQADPEVDAAAAFRDRCADDATPYLAANTFGETLGVKTLQLPAEANTDVQNAKAAVNRFSLGFQRVGGTSGAAIQIEAIENSATDEAKLTITYTLVQIVTLSGGITPSGTLTKQVNKPLTGGITPSGALAKQVNKIFTGGITPSGILTTLKVKFITLAGGITPVGTLVKQVAKTLSGGITPTGALTKQAQKTLGGGITPTGALVKQVNKPFSCVITPTGALIKKVSKTFSGGITPSGSLSVGIIKPLKLLASYILTLAKAASYWLTTEKKASYCPQIDLEAQI